MFIAENLKIQRTKMERKLICNLPLTTQITNIHISLYVFLLFSLPSSLLHTHRSIFLSCTLYTLLAICFLLTTLWRYFLFHLHFRLTIPLLWGTAQYIIHGNEQSNWRHLEWFNQCGLWYWRWKQRDNSLLTLDCGSVSCLWQRTPNRNEYFASGMAVY